MELAESEYKSLRKLLHLADIAYQMNGADKEDLKDIKNCKRIFQKYLEMNGPEIGYWWL